MENANKALVMAASTLLAVMLLTLFVTFIGKVSKWPETEDTIKNTEQIVAFNKEYEVFQKSAMYGADVISCLNKAKNNNEKYVEGGIFIDDGTGVHGEDYLIDIEVEIKKALTESIEVTAKKANASGTYTVGVVYGETELIKPNIYLGQVFGIDEYKMLTDFESSDSLMYNNVTNTFSQIRTFNLLNSDKVLEKLLQHSDSPKKVVKNSGNNDVYNTYESPKKYGWVSATWSTYLDSFKKKKFKCTNLEYCEKTGRVNKLEFEEI